MAFPKKIGSGGRGLYGFGFRFRDQHLRERKNKYMARFPSNPSTIRARHPFPNVQR